MTREESIEQLKKLEDKTLERLAKFSANQKIKAFFTNEIMYQTLLAMLRAKNLM